MTVSLAWVRKVGAVEELVAASDSRPTEQSDTDRTVVARSFVVRDGQGQRRAELGAVIPEGQTEENPLVPDFEE
jgi:hypothetical protein